MKTYFKRSIVIGTSKCLILTALYTAFITRPGIGMSFSMLASNLSCGTTLLSNSTNAFLQKHLRDDFPQFFTHGRSQIFIITPFKATWYYNLHSRASIKLHFDAWATVCQQVLDRVSVQRPGLVLWETPEIHGPAGVALSKSSDCLLFITLLVYEKVGITGASKTNL